MKVQWPGDSKVGARYKTPNNVKGVVLAYRHNSFMQAGGSSITLNAIARPTIRATASTRRKSLSTYICGQRWHKQYYCHSTRTSC